MATEFFSIKGIRCASCIANIERALKKVEGIIHVQISLVSSKAEIEFNETKLTVKAIVQHIENIGYEASPLPSHDISNIKKEDKTEDESLQKLLRKLITLMLFCIPLVALSMFTMHVTGIAFSTIIAFSSAQLFLTLPIMILAVPMFTSGIKALIALRPTMDTLVMLGTSTAFIYSLVQTVYIFLGDMNAYSLLYFESSGTIITLITLGEYLEKRAKRKASKSLQALVSLAPSTATQIFADSSTKIVSVSSLQIGDDVIVQQGLSVPIDGTIINGEGTLNEAMLTGEALPIYKKNGDTVFAGTLLTEGVITIKATTNPSQTQLHKLIHAVEKAQSSKAPIAKIADTIANYFVPIVLVIAFSAMGIWLYVGQSIPFALGIVITTLIIACPCAMGLATPLSLVIAMGRALHFGIVIKNGTALQTTAQIDTVFFDKTGTLTNGTPFVHTIYTVGEMQQEKLMEYIHAIIPYSHHPSMQAVAEYTKNIQSSYAVSSFEYSIGKGSKSVIYNSKEGTPLFRPMHTVHIGSERFMEELGFYNKENNTVLNIAEYGANNSIAQEENNSLCRISEKIQKNGASPLFIAEDGKIIAIIAIKDIVREDAKKTIEALKANNIESVLLSGDTAFVVESIATELGIRTWKAQVLPEDKARIIEEYKAQGKHCMMVGDGINDAVALCVADVGVAMGKGVDIAQEASSIVLVTESLYSIYSSIILSRATLINIKQNFFLAFLYNCISIPVACGILYIWGGPLLTPMIASGAMVLSSLCVVGNALRLQSFKIQ